MRARLGATRGGVGSDDAAQELRGLARRRQRLAAARELRLCVCAAANDAGAQLEQVRASIPTLEGQRQTALFRLSVLTGRPPAEFPREVTGCETPPALARPIPVGDGATLLSRRPDVRQAERELAAATARVGVATASLYPSVSLGGSVGTSSTSLSGLGSSESFRFSVGPLISFSLTNLVVGRARIAQAQAGQAQSRGQFFGNVLFLGANLYYTRVRDYQAVTSIAISMIRSVSGCSPVISMSIQIRLFGL